MPQITLNQLVEELEKSLDLFYEQLTSYAHGLHFLKKTWETSYITRFRNYLLEYYQDYATQDLFKCYQEAKEQGKLPHLGKLSPTEIDKLYRWALQEKTLLDRLIESLQTKLNKEHLFGIAFSLDLFENAQISSNPDNGYEISEEAYNRLKNPFYETKALRSKHKEG